MEFVEQQAIDRKVDRIELLGDLTHNHAILRLEVLEFWEHWLERLAKTCQTVVLVGNHDQTGDHNRPTNALSIYKRISNENLVIVDNAVQLGAFGYIPYVHDFNTFLLKSDMLYNLGARILICHQTFNGAKYETGMFAPDGFDQDKIPFNTIISGHIHARQRFGKVIYPGTAKWDTNSDANEEKGLWLVNHDNDGSILSEEFIDTSKVCSAIYQITWKEGDEQPAVPEGRVTVELVGSSDWIKKEKEKLKGKVSVKSKITDKAKAENRRAGNSLEDFINSTFSPIPGIDKAKMLEFIKELK